MTEDEALYADDPNHPIPITNAIDYVEKFADGGCLMEIVIAGQMHRDDRTRSRLARKIENYAAYAWSDDFAAHYGADAAARTGILVRFRLPPPREVIDLIERVKPILAARSLVLGWDVG